MIVVLMGVCGSGKTVVGQALATDLGWPFFDGDDFHPPASVAKMAAGTPLADADRWPWLDRLAAEMAAVNERGADAVLACSALRQAYRDRIGRAGNIRFVHLEGDYDTIAARLAARSHRYMPSTLLASQLATLEEPKDAIVIDVRDSIPVQIAKIRMALNLAASVGPASVGPASAGRSGPAVVGPAVVGPASAGRSGPAPCTPPEGGPTARFPEGGPTLGRIA